MTRFTTCRRFFRLMAAMAGLAAPLAHAGPAPLCPRGDYAFQASGAGPNELSIKVVLPTPGYVVTAAVEPGSAVPAMVEIRCEEPSGMMVAQVLTTYARTLRTDASRIEVRDAGGSQLLSVKAAGAAASAAAKP